MTKSAKKPRYGYVAFASSSIVSSLLIISGILIGFLYSTLLGVIVFFLGLYSLCSYLTSLYFVNPFKSLDLSKVLPLKGDERVLDVGCGLGRATIGAAKLLHSGKIIGVDIWDRLEIPGNSQEKAYENAAIEGVEDKVEFRYGDAFDLPFDSDSFDVVMCAGLLTSFHSDEKKSLAMKEIHRVLKSNGLFYMREPILHLKTIIVLTPSVFFLRLPSKKHWIELLKETGFSNITYRPHRIAGSFRMIKP